MHVATYAFKHNETMVFAFHFTSFQKSMPIQVSIYKKKVCKPFKTSNYVHKLYFTLTNYEAEIQTYTHIYIRLCFMKMNLHLGDHRYSLIHTLKNIFIYITSIEMLLEATTQCVI